MLSTSRQLVCCFSCRSSDVVEAFFRGRGSKDFQRGKAEPRQLRCKARRGRGSKLTGRGKATNAHGEAREGQDNAETRQELKFHTKTTGRSKYAVGKMR